MSCVINSGYHLKNLKNYGDEKKLKFFFFHKLVSQWFNISCLKKESFNS